MSKDVVDEYIARRYGKKQKPADAGEKATGKRDVVGEYIARVNKEREHPASSR